MDTTKDPIINKAAAKARANVGLRTAINILEKWKASNEQAMQVLGVSAATYHRAKSGKTAVALSQDQLERTSYILNIHAALRTIFDNPENVYGFVRMPNDNTFFNGETPLSIMTKGSMANLYETYKRIDALRGAGW